VRQAMPIPAGVASSPTTLIARGRWFGRALAGAASMRQPARVSDGAAPSCAPHGHALPPLSQSWTVEQCALYNVEG
jgi:hypothetical protein